MRLIIISDSHGSVSRLEDVVFEQPKADLFIFLGDGEWDVDQVRGLHPDKEFLCVAGNCDMGSALPPDLETVAGGKRIFLTHGHKYGVKFGDVTIIAEARRRGAEILLYGHTHRAFSTYEDGLYILNPGSLGHPGDANPTYGVIDITPAGIVTNIVEV